LLRDVLGLPCDEIAKLAGRSRTPAMVGEALAVWTLGAESIDLPGFAELAPGSLISAPVSLVMHRCPPRQYNGSYRPAE
jgi:hypothetical protein